MKEIGKYNTGKLSKSKKKNKKGQLCDDKMGNSKYDKKIKEIYRMIYTDC